MQQVKNSNFPGWWLCLSGLTIAVFSIYIPYFLNSGIRIDTEKADPDLSFQRKAESLQTGKAIFQTNCAICHGQLGEGGIGPNLTDKFWLHGNRPKDLLKIIQEGIPERGMAGWENILPPQNIKKVRDFVLTIKGSNPPNAKASQGREYED
ncbi:MAG: c-type cytochrome [SAR324 cluster bacterium]|nr:c-type cytochrome [SAR324 cluster bacterium]